MNGADEEQNRKDNIILGIIPFIGGLPLLFIYFLELPASFGLGFAMLILVGGSSVAMLGMTIKKFIGFWKKINE